ncbi:hypothetical protein E2C01_036393 [Portunus trituberculatus]|uniref:Uncharacterized protein n=1 Tax=Portunus trituberculatus TaxID=210409 RepID=A0A5B7FBX9_PORTR|nr:hypothetical protein [Portunus trituberculatus]
MRGSVGATLAGLGFFLDRPGSCWVEALWVHRLHALCHGRALTSRTSRTAQALLSPLENISQTGHDCLELIWLVEDRIAKRVEALRDRKSKNQWPSSPVQRPGIIWTAHWYSTGTAAAPEIGTARRDNITALEKKRKQKTLLRKDKNTKQNKLCTRDGAM